MKILFATHEGVPFYRGGPYVKILRLKEHLQQLGIEVQLLNLWEAGSGFLNCDLVHLFGANFAVYNLARNLKYHNVRFVVNPIFFTRHSAFKVRAVSVIDKITRKILRGVWWEFGFTRDICHWAEWILPNTQAEGEIISRGFGIPRAKIKVIHNGVSREFLNADPAIFKKHYGMENFILTVGHIGPDRKNILALVRALSRIDHPAIIIARKLNTGETEQILKESRKNKNLKIIEGLPHDSPLLASAYAACEVFVLPSKFETPGRAAMEAALAGAKIVITPYGGTREYFKDLAQYVNPYSVDSIRRGIEKALNQPKNPALREHINKNFVWEKIAGDTFNLYQEIMRIG